MPLDDPRTISLGQIGGLAGRLDDRGHPARSVGASFSSIPQQGKLKALICTATPCSGVRMCWADEAAVLRQRLDIALGQDAGVGQFAPPFRGVAEQRADAALDIDPAVAGRGPGGSDRAWNSSFCPSAAWPSAFSISARSWKDMARSAAPARRPCSSARGHVEPEASISATGPRPVAASRSSAPSRAPAFPFGRRCSFPADRALVGHREILQFR
jgi:hypothetical protein